MASPKKEDLLTRLVGRQLSSVEFVQDYVQLRFDGPCLNAFTPPTVAKADRSLAWNSPGYRDMLCENIGKHVSRALVREGDAIVVEFQNGGIISISLLPADYRGAEAAIITFTEKDWAVW